MVSLALNDWAVVLVCISDVSVIKIKVFNWQFWELGEDSGIFKFLTQLHVHTWKTSTMQNWGFTLLWVAIHYANMPVQFMAAFYGT